MAVRIPTIARDSNGETARVEDCSFGLIPYFGGIPITNLTNSRGGSEVPFHDRGIPLCMRYLDQ